jgi:hypothetical protein
MPRADQTSQAETPGPTSFGQPRDPSHEENLAAALSSFLSQLNSCLDVPRLDETVDVTDSLGPGGPGTAASPSDLPPVARSPGLKRVLPAGALERSLYGSPSHSSPPSHSAAYGPTLSRASGPVVTRAPAPVPGRVVTSPPVALVTSTPAPVAAPALSPVPSAEVTPPAVTRPAVTRPPTTPSAATPPAVTPPSVVPTKAGPVVAPSAAQNVAPAPEEQGDIYPERAPKTSWRARWAREPAEAKPATARPYRRLFLAGAVVVAVLAATTASTTVAWQRAERDLSLQGQQLTAAQNTLASTRSSLSAQGQGTVALQTELHHSAQQWSGLEAQLAQAEDQLSRTKGELSRAQDQLGQAQSEVSQAQSRADRAQGQARQAQLRAGAAQDQARAAQSQLGHTQLNLSATQATAAVCQQGAVLGQQDVQLLSTLVYLENSYLGAAGTRDMSRMQQDTAQIQALDAQQQTLSPRFSSSVELCTSGR